MQISLSTGWHDNHIIAFQGVPSPRGGPFYLQVRDALAVAFARLGNVDATVHGRPGMRALATCRQLQLAAIRPSPSPGTTGTSTPVPK
jgi:hypothetical protein